MYDGCELTRAEAELLIMSLSLRYNFSNVALDKTLRVIDALLPHSVFKSKYRFLNTFKNLSYIEYYFCPDCPSNLEFDEASNITQCKFCNTVYDKKKIKELGNYFYYIPLENQLQDIVNSPLYLKFCKQSEQSDIVNGTVYNNLVEMGVIKEDDITIQWNCDGVQIFKSSFNGLTPILVLINELEYRFRKDNVILCGLINGTKPPMDVFLKPFVNELLKLSREGFKSTTYKSSLKKQIKVHCLLSPVDSIARPDIQNMKYFNGNFLNEHISLCHLT